MNTYPTFDIANMKAFQISHELFNVDRFDNYLLNNPHVGHFHKHSFYHFVLFTQGTGHQIIDFETFPISPNMMYFMHPDQSHKWFLEENSQGYLINFSGTFLEKYGVSSQILENFEFFRIFSQKQVFEIHPDSQKEIIKHFEAILQEFEHKNLKDKHYELWIITHVLQILILASREISLETENNLQTQKGKQLYIKYLKMVENDYKHRKLPSQYAAKLHITPNHLNYICQTYGRNSAGDIIRKRILLEAKRLLVNFDKAIYEIAFELNFSDSSYFVKFFKKYTSLTPDQFRKEHYYED